MLRVTQNKIEQGEQENPDQVNEVPVQSSVFSIKARLFCDSSVMGKALLRR